jgi:rhodanese-related sulfurtransferase
MSQKILHINARLAVPPEEFERDNGAESAQGLVDVPGLLWKIAYLNRESMEAGGFYLFEDEATMQNYLDGPIVAQLSGYPLWADMSIKKLDILVEFSEAVRAPIGKKYALEEKSIKTFNQMAAEAFASVPIVKPEELHLWMQQEPKPLIINVQDAVDFALTGSIPGSVNISLGSLTYKADHKLPEEWRDTRLNDRAMLIVTTCAMGPLGALGGKLLQDMGYTKVYILEGGIQAWKEAGYETQFENQKSS